MRGNRGNPYLPGPHFAADDPRLAWALPLDRRIHFALNCGGVSCPPIRVYVPEMLDQQLDWAAHGFVDTAVSVRPEQHEVVLSPIFRWYAADFGGRVGVARFLLDHLPDDACRSFLSAAGDGLRFTYTRYDWGLNGV